MWAFEVRRTAVVAIVSRVGGSVVAAICGTRRRATSSESRGGFVAVAVALEVACITCRVEFSGVRVGFVAVAALEDVRSTRRAELSGNRGGLVALEDLQVESSNAVREKWRHGTSVIVIGPIRRGRERTDGLGPNPLLHLHH